jgi:hypothetical protein
LLGATLEGKYRQVNVSVVLCITNGGLKNDNKHPYESGLADSAMQSPRGWAKNEEMIDWIAFQGPKIYEAWKDIGAVCRSKP